MYQIEHDEMFAAIRAGKPINNGEAAAASTLLALMGRTAAYTGEVITPEIFLNSKEDLSPPDTNSARWPCPGPGARHDQVCLRGRTLPVVTRLRNDVPSTTWAFRLGLRFTTDRGHFKTSPRHSYAGVENFRIGVDDELLGSYGQVMTTFFDSLLPSDDHRAGLVDSRDWASRLL